MIVQLEAGQSTSKTLVAWHLITDRVVEILSGRVLDNAGLVRHMNGTAGRSAIRKYRTYENNAE